MQSVSASLTLYPFWQPIQKYHRNQIWFSFEVKKGRIKLGEIPQVDDPSPTNADLHAHWNDPWVLVQLASRWQGFDVHSLLSGEENCSS